MALVLCAPFCSGPVRGRGEKQRGNESAGELISDFYDSCCSLVLPDSQTHPASLPCRLLSLLPSADPCPPVRGALRRAAPSPRSARPAQLLAPGKVRTWLQCWLCPTPRGNWASTSALWACFPRGTKWNLALQLRDCWVGKGISLCFPSPSLKPLSS